MKHKKYRIVCRRCGRREIAVDLIKERCSCGNSGRDNFSHTVIATCDGTGRPWVPVPAT